MPAVSDTYIVFCNSSMSTRSAVLVPVLDKTSTVGVNNISVQIVYFPLITKIPTAFGLMFKNNCRVHLLFEIHRIFVVAPTFCPR